MPLEINFGSNGYKWVSMGRPLRRLLQNLSLSTSRIGKELSVYIPLKLQVILNQI